jgi:hypothetical protein
VSERRWEAIACIGFIPAVAFAFAALIALTNLIVP